MKSQNPRRGRHVSRPPSLASTADVHASRSRYQLKKNQTFHSKSPSSSDDEDPLADLACSPRRSSTSPAALQAILAGQQRMNKLLSRFDLDSSDSAPRQERDGLPVPRGYLDIHFERSQSGKGDSFHYDLRRGPSRKDSQTKVRKVHCHPSDSGLGTSISSCETASARQGELSLLQAPDMHFNLILPAAKESRSKTVTRTQSAITSSLMAVEPESASKQNLSLSASEEIEKRILTPLLGQEFCKPFHHLVESAREQIEKKQIGTLRDLEKSLLHGAAVSTIRTLASNCMPLTNLQDVEAEVGSYYQFCSSTILCLSETYTHLDPRDLCIPTDKSYSNSYFLDLTAQVHRFKAMRDEARKNKKEASYVYSLNNRQRPETDQLSELKLTLEGGMSQTGRPLELVAQKEGQAVSMQTGEAYDAHAPPLVKRTLSLNEADEGARRSMARRKKNAPPMNINTKCSHCDKIFQRPCDLT